VSGWLFVGVDSVIQREGLWEEGKKTIMGCDRDGEV
jgi:hypothetical protein